MSAPIWFLLGCAFAALAQHPFVTYPLSLFLLRRRPARAPEPSAARATISVCMSAFNEERVIVAKMERLLAMADAHGAATLHVYVDGAQDRTAELIAPYADRADIVFGEGRNGKTFGLNTLVARSAGELLAFTDTNVETPVDGLVALGAAFADPSVDCVTARLGYTNAEESGMSAANAAYWRLEEAIKTRESETVGVVGVDGAFFMMRRAAYEPAPPHLIDDLYTSLVVFCSGGRVVSAPQVRVFERNAVRSGEEVRRKARIACQAFNVQRALWPRLRRVPPARLYAFLSHRTLKWLMPFTAAAAALCWLAAVGALLGWAWTFALAAAGAAAVVLATWAGMRPARAAVSAALSLYGVGLGVLQSVFTRRTYTVWAPAASIRN